MDAIEFVKQLRRMNAQGVSKNHFIYPCAGQEPDSPEEIVAEVEQWSKEHPRKTRQSVFLEQWPDARVDSNGVLAICPANVSAEHRYQSVCLARPCGICCREFWMQEVE